jgi:hypothetical protein
MGPVWAIHPGYAVKNKNPGTTNPHRKVYACGHSLWDGPWPTNLNPRRVHNKDPQEVSISTKHEAVLQGPRQACEVYCTRRCQAKECRQAQNCLCCVKLPPSSHNKSRCDTYKSQQCISSLTRINKMNRLSCVADDCLESVCVCGLSQIYGASDATFTPNRIW